jgi:hypothetical protein
MRAKDWLLYIREILVTIDTVNAIDSMPCIVATVTVEAKLVGSRDESHSCFTRHRKITFLDCFYSYSIAAKPLKVKDFC